MRRKEHGSPISDEKLQGRIRDIKTRLEIEVTCCCCEGKKMLLKGIGEESLTFAAEDGTEKEFRWEDIVRWRIEGAKRSYVKSAKRLCVGCIVVIIFIAANILLVSSYIKNKNVVTETRMISEVSYIGESTWGCYYQVYEIRDDGGEVGPVDYEKSITVIYRILEDGETPYIEKALNKYGELVEYRLYLPEGMEL